MQVEKSNVATGGRFPGGVVISSEMEEARQKLRERLGDGVRTGGRGSVRRKKRATVKPAATDDKKLQNTLKRLGMNSIPGIEEVNLFKDDSTVINFSNPKVQASIGANTYVVSGNADCKPLKEMLPLLPQLLTYIGSENLGYMKDLLEETFADPSIMKKASALRASELNAAEKDAEDEEVPDLVDDFEQVSKTDSSSK
eukprot:TRINITY_DN167160_c0_g1_i1.p1 TRINITY_DN167160_c0_g1~~TRINITY_DN167160_c0_g1_i1.p1  ORF type:complete len:198 (+),score=32.86 TRINITY_DN167160_c0_g1_i1:135-728(+)